MRFGGSDFIEIKPHDSSDHPPERFQPPTSPARNTGFGRVPHLADRFRFLRLSYECPEHVNIHSLAYADKGEPVARQRKTPDQGAAHSHYIIYVHLD